MSVSWLIGVQLVKLFCSCTPVVLFDTQGVQHNAPVKSSSGLICDLIVAVMIHG